MLAIERILAAAAMSPSSGFFMTRRSTTWYCSAPIPVPEHPTSNTI